MAQRRQSFFDAIATPATPMTPKGGSQTMYGSDAPPPDQMPESPDTFRRRTTPVTGQPTPGRTQIEEVIAMLTGGQ